MVSDPDVEYFGSFEVVPESGPPKDLDTDHCWFCGQAPGSVVVDVGETPPGRSWAIGRWWALCRDCVAVGSRDGAEGLLPRATEELAELPMLDEIVQSILAALRDRRSM
ncbi:hypothetical protein ACLM5J_07840 [Nocardioides sp. Bht2]|uniref:hypothetical protein n=1 Tax=Nocardioides sp. Bht2 TaxID=3392297 RepID=UPI0039B37967